ncbi:MAG: cysteine desulfurase family protein [Gammaproteobacteria bacterium]|nr:cysteine desulfurase family protein [Gammaproteobacteria bacterium]
MKQQPVYLDYQATTPLDPRVRESMMPFLCENFGNPHSTDHVFGWEAAAAVRDARAKVAEFINADDDEVLFTSGATEACHLALGGVARCAGDGCNRKRIVTVTTEHPAVLETVLGLGRQGFESVVLPVKSDGLVDLAALDRVLDERTLIVSVMTANNEIGVLQPIREIADRCRHVGALLHTDAAQAGGRLPMDVERLGVDLLSLSAHKMYGPKGVGALFVRAGVPILPIWGGGGQQRGLRSGTLAPALVAGFGTACELAVDQQESDRERISQLTVRLLQRLRNAFPSLLLFGHPERRVPGSVNIGFPGIPAELMIRNVAESLAVSSGAACASASSEPSRVLLALGLDRETAATGIRISLGRFTTEADIDAAIGVFECVGTALHSEPAQHAAG